jgi:hypothetical protein
MSELLWRVGRSQPINLYYGGEYVAVAFGSPAIAAAIVERMNEPRPPVGGFTCGVCLQPVWDNGIGLGYTHVTEPSPMHQVDAVQVPAPLYLIWSNHHGMWWKPNAAGYTGDARNAGRWTLEDGEIRMRGRDWPRGSLPPEILVQRPPDVVLGQPFAEEQLRSLAEEISRKFVASRDAEEEASYGAVNE